MHIEHFRTDFEKLAVPMAIADPAANMIEANAAFCNYLGYARSALLGMSVFDYTHPDDLERTRTLFDKVAGGEIDNFQYEKRYLRKDGAIVWAVVTTSWVPESDSGPPICVAVIHDITPRMSAQRKLQESEELHRALVDHVSLGIALIDENHTILKINPAQARMFDQHPDDLLGKKCFREFEKRDHICEHCPGVRALKDGQAQVVETEGVREDGSRFLVNIHAVPVFGSDGTARKFIEVVEDLTQKRALESELRQNHDQLNYLAHHDQLTELPNRTLLYDRLKHAIDRAQRLDEGLAGVVFALDRFKKINQTLGFEVGKRVLAEAAERLKAQLRTADNLCRMGDTEFALVLEKANSLQRSSKVAKKILSALNAKNFSVDGHELHITASVGISHFPDDGKDVETLLRAAEASRTSAREKGGDGYQYFRPELEKGSRALLALEGQLHNALEKEQLIAYYQPQVDPASGRIIGFEALARWEHPEKGLVSPAEFIPVAEETGLIVPLGRRMLEVACRQAMQWHEAGLFRFRVAVNISALQIAKGHLVQTVKNILNKTGLSAERLEVEITETALINEPAMALKTLTALKNMGVSVALDDFGTGYSALGYLKNYPIDRIKIAQDFIRNVPFSAHDAIIVESVIALGKKLGISVIAEGVETADHLRCLIDLGCTEIQGYYFSRPLDAKTATEQLQAWHGPDGVCPLKV
jgi:diguanylate cyclase (GGDEF)-like protein/PAS domain S-box-containing protein